MGYVPPIVDSQMLIYGNRQPLKSQLVYVTPSTERVNFLDALRSDPDAYRQYEAFKQSQDHSDNFAETEDKKEYVTKQVERKVTGKGKTIDFTV